jgi:hypothetical protein
LFQGTPVLGKDKPRWVISNLAETKSHTGATFAAWLADIPRRIGERLFMSCDEEANWRGWDMTPLHGGLGRRYRDPRFDSLHPGPQQLGALDGGGEP